MDSCRSIVSAHFFGGVRKMKKYKGISELRNEKLVMLIFTAPG